jgi:hypothetical protein
MTQKAPFSQVGGPLLRLGEDYCTGRISDAHYCAEYEGVIEACGWTKEEYFAEVERRWDVSWALTDNPKA